MSEVGVVEEGAIATLAPAKRRKVGYVRRSKATCSTMDIRHQDRMKQDIDYKTVSTSYDPLLLYRLIETTILAQTEDQYPFATVYEQEASFYSFRQEQMTGKQTT
jgi:hypothetical protein